VKTLAVAAQQQSGIVKLAPQCLTWLRLGLSDGAAIVLTVNQALDRTGKLVEGPLQPDQPTSPEQAEAAALAWLADKGCH